MTLYLNMIDWCEQSIFYVTCVITCWLITSSLCSLRCVRNHSVARDDGSIKKGQATLWVENKDQAQRFRFCCFVVVLLRKPHMLIDHHHFYLRHWNEVPVHFSHLILFCFMASCSRILYDKIIPPIRPIIVKLAKRYNLFWLQMGHVPNLSPRSLPKASWPVVQTISAQFYGCEVVLLVILVRAPPRWLNSCSFPKGWAQPPLRGSSFNCLYLQSYSSHNQLYYKGWNTGNK